MSDEYTIHPVLAEAELRKQLREEAVSDMKLLRDQLQAVKEAEEKAIADRLNDRRGLTLDAAVGGIRAIPGFFEEVFDLAATLDEGMMANILDVFPDIRFGHDPRDPEGGLTFFKLSAPESKLFPLPSIARASEKGFREIKQLLPETERLTGALAEPIGKFVLGFVTGKKVLKGLSLLQGTSRGAQLANTVLAGSVADALAFDGHEQRLSDFLVSFDNPLMNNAVTQYLASNENDSELEGRFKNILEGAGLGLLIDSFIAGVRGIRAFRMNRAIEKAVKEADDARMEMPDAPEPNPITKKAAKEKAAKEIDDAAKAADDPVKVADDGTAVKLTEDEIIQVSKTDLRAEIRATMQVTEQQQVAFSKALAAGDEEGAMKVLKDFNEDTIDWSKVKDADDIKQVMLATEEVFAPMIDAAKGGVQSNKQLRMLANLVGATPAQVRNLHSAVRDGGGIAAKFYSAYRTMMASAVQVKRTAQASLDNPGSAFHMAEALRSVQVHAALQAEVKGAQTEIARALQGMGLIKESAAENYREFEVLRRQFAGSGIGKGAWEKQMDALLGQRGLDNLADFNARTRMTPYQRAKNIFIEYTINSMLSSPKTHMINLVSNILNTVIYSLDRSLGGSYRFLVHGEKAAIREARIDVYDKLTRMDEAWKLAKQAWRDGAPVTDKRQRIEFKTRMSISVEGTSRDVLRESDEAAPEFGAKILARKTEVIRGEGGDIVRAIDFKSWQRVINTLGRVIRIPGRSLITGDEFFKAVNRNAEISVLAFRKADEEAVAKGLTYGSDAYEKFVLVRSKKLGDITIRDPENILIQSRAIEKARLVTFQEAPHTTIGSKAEQFVNANSYVKLIIAPFFRTPMNIIRQGAFDRTPIGFLFKHNQEILRTGNPRDKAEIVARMFTGVAAMSAFYGLTSSGEDGDTGFEIIGKVPFGTSAKEAGILDYSIRLGDNWYQFSRLEPMGMWLGIIADMRTATKYNDGDEDEWAFALGQGAMASFMNGVGNKTFMKSISDIQEMFEGVGTGKKGTIEKALARFAAGEFGKLIPQLLKASARGLEGDGDSFQQEAWTVLDILSARSSLFNENLSQQHDTLGRPISRDAGLSILINPFALSESSDDPVDKEFFRLGFILKKMPKTLGAAGFELSASEYSTLTGLVARTGLHQALTAMVTGDAWDSLTDPMKSFLMKERIKEARIAARLMFLAEPGIAKRISEKKIDAITLLTDD